MVRVPSLCAVLCPLQDAEALQEEVAKILECVHEIELHSQAMAAYLHPQDPVYRPTMAPTKFDQEVEKEYNAIAEGNK